MRGLVFTASEKQCTQPNHMLKHWQLLKIHINCYILVLSDNQTFPNLIKICKKGIYSLHKN